MSLLPSSPDISGTNTPRVIGLDSEEANELMAALSSETARRILAALHEEPAPPAELADRVDTSLQNAQYHLERLEDAGAIEVAGTAYSEKGREMSVYGPADSPLVIYAGETDRLSGLKAAVSRLFAGFLLLGAAAALVQAAFGEALLADDAGPVEEQEEAAEEGDVGAFDAPEVADRDSTAATDPEAADGLLALFEGLFAGGMPPGLAFFLGGALVLTIIIGVNYYRSRP